MAYAGNWKGFLKLSFVTCAVRLSPATTSAEHISFHLINPETGNRVRMKPHDAETDDVLDRKDLVKGYEYEKGQYVRIGDEELDRLKIESSRTINIVRFTDVADIDRRFFDTPYYVVPDGRVAVESFRVIQEAIAEQKLVGIARLVQTSRERVVAIEPRDRGMIATTLRSPEEVRDFKPLFEEIGGKAIDREMVTLAKKLIEQMTGAFDPRLFEDRYQAALRELVEAKLKGIKPKLAAPERTAQVINLYDALKKSVASTRGAPHEPRPTPRPNSRSSHTRQPAERRRRLKRTG